MPPWCWQSGGGGVTSLIENREGDSTLHKTSYRNISQNLEDASFSIALKLQHRCPGSCQISKRSGVCESLWDLTIRRLMRWWIGPQVSSHLILTTGVIQTTHHYLQQWLSLLTLICVYRRRWIKELYESIVTIIYWHPQKSIPDYSILSCYMNTWLLYRMTNGDHDITLLWK